MSQPLLPCPSCQRHVFADACACPFCATQLRVCGVTRAAAASGQLSRAALLAAGAAALAGVAACGGPAMPTPAYGAPVDASADAPPDAGHGDSSVADVPLQELGPVDRLIEAPPQDADIDRPVVPIYGAAAPVQRKPVP